MACKIAVRAAGFSTKEIFNELLEAAPEKANVSLRPSFGRLLRKEVLPEVEAEFIARYSLPQQDEYLVGNSIRSGMKRIDRAMSKMVHHHERKKFRKTLASLWYDEMDIEENLEMAFFPHGAVAQRLAGRAVILPFERNYLQALLKVKRFANRMPKGFAFRSMKELNNTVDEIDPTIYGFEEKIERSNDRSSPEF